VEENQGSGGGLTAILLLGLFVAWLVLFHPFRSSSPQAFGGDGTGRKTGFTCKVTEDRPKGTPCRIKIPAIGVDAKVIQLGLLPDRHLEVPTDYSKAGWWSGGTRPGQRGPAVIVGHVDSRSAPGVFYRLKDLDPGDVVKIWLAGGRLVEYSVRDMGQYPKADFPSELVDGRISYAGLRLITCGGAFNHATGHYLDNVIVFARLIP
jgi:hypothetical protein